MEHASLFGAPHRRLNRLTGEYVLVSPHRTARPWQGQVEDPVVEERPEYDPACYLCPGNARAGGARTLDYTSTYVFDNDFAALLPGISPETLDRDGLLVAETERGICRVIRFSPRHDLSLMALSYDNDAGLLPVLDDDRGDALSAQYLNPARPGTWPGTGL